MVANTDNSHIERDDTLTHEIAINKESLHFSCAHFTIFSATSRENLHGHNYVVQAKVTTSIGDEGLCFNYNILKNLLQELCDQLDEHTLLPTRSPFLALENDEDYVVAIFNDERLPFLERDVLKIAVRNVTIEELARWFVKQLCATSEFAELPIDELALSVSSGPSESTTAVWRKA